MFLNVASFTSFLHILDTILVTTILYAATEVKIYHHTNRVVAVHTSCTGCTVLSLTEVRSVLVLMRIQNLDDDITQYNAISEPIEIFYFAVAIAKY